MTDTATTTTEPGTGTGPGARPDPPPRYGRLALLGGLALAAGWAVVTAEMELSELLSGPAELWRMAMLMFTPPDVTYFGRALSGTVESVQIAWIGTLIGATLSLPLGLFAAKNVSSSAVSTVIRQILNGFRSIHELVFAILFVSVVGLGALPGTLAIGIHSIGTLGKWTSEAVESMELGPVEAARASGASSVGVMRWGVLPQVLPEIVAFWLYRFEINVRASAILGVVGAGGVGELLANTLTYRRFDKAGMAIIVVIGAVLIIDAISSRIRARIIHGGPAGTA